MYDLMIPEKKIVLFFETSHSADISLSVGGWRLRSGKNVLHCRFSSLGCEVPNFPRS